MRPTAAPCSLPADQRWQRLVESNVILESAPDAMMIVDEQGRILAVNGQTEATFGFNRQELLGRPIEMLMPDRFHGQHRAERERFAGQPRHRPMGIGMEVIARRKDGSEFPAEVSLRPIPTEEGLFVASAIRDITRRKQTEQSLRENEVQLLAAQRIQEHLLPAACPQLPGFDVAGAMHPAEFAAGDYYDFVPMSAPAVAFAIGDVSGHGFASALLMAATHAHVRLLAQLHDDPAEILARANALLSERGDGERFVTLLLAKLDPLARSLVYASAGHPSGYVLSADGRLKTRLASTSMPLGLETDTCFCSAGPIALAPGDLVLFLTDGLLDARDAGSRPFGEEGVLATAAAHCHRPAREIVDALHRAVLQFSGRPKPGDDVTAIVVKVQA